MAKTISELKAANKEYNESPAQLVQDIKDHACWEIQDKYDAACEAVRAIKTWSTKTYHDADFQLISAAEDNAASGDYDEKELELGGEQTGIFQAPEFKTNRNAAFYLAAYGTLHYLVEEMAEEDLEFYKVIYAAINNKAAA
jgi:hypothetical protein|tara:strand:- start:223 stop:645 length:423 start_codon:yes stop_codon:yes gene_type:complete